MLTRLGSLQQLLKKYLYFIYVSFPQKDLVLLSQAVCNQSLHLFL